MKKTVLGEGKQHEKQVRVGKRGTVRERSNALNAVLS
jgi:hypothetical protein